MKATKKQLALIHIAKAELERCGFDDTCYRDLLRELFGVESSRDLRSDQVDRLLREFRRLGWDRDRVDRGPRVAEPKPRPPRDGDDVITPRQQQAIDALREFLGWSPRGLQKFCKDRLKFWWPQSRRDGQKLLYALLAIGSKQLLRAARTLHPEDLTEWEEDFVFGAGGAVEELEQFVERRNRRGQRRMPAVSTLKLIEIITTRSRTCLYQDIGP